METLWLPRARCPALRPRGAPAAPAMRPAPTSRALRSTWRGGAAAAQRSLCGSSASSFRRAMGARARLARCRPGPQRPSRMHQERVAARHAHASGVHGRRGGVAGVWPVQPGLVLRAHGAARAPDRAVALEAAAKGDLPDAVPALDALRSGGSTERSGSGPTTCLRGRTVSP